MLYGLYPRKGAIAVGSDADIVLFDPAAAWRISTERLHMNTDFSPYEGREMIGRVIATLSRGEVVYRDGDVKAEKGRGRFLRRENREW